MPAYGFEWQDLLVRRSRSPTCHVGVHSYIISADFLLNRWNSAIRAYNRILGFNVTDEHVRRRCSYCLLGTQFSSVCERLFLHAISERKHVPCCAGWRNFRTWWRLRGQISIAHIVRPLTTLTSRLDANLQGERCSPVVQKLNLGRS